MNVSDPSWTPNPPPADSSPTGELDRQDFLKLLINQIAQQDPLNPADSSEFLAQLAQFSGLEQMISMNSKLDALALSEAASTSTSMATLIGREVTAIGDTVELGETEPAELVFELPADTESLEVSITDSNGQVVRTYELSGRSAGAQQISWDGCDQDGNRLPPGEYRFSVSGVDAEGNAVEASERTSGIVTGITFDKGYPELLIGDRRISLGDVIEIV
jgi:flagellar basal-body rod modification protein FlgD